MPPDSTDAAPPRLVVVEAPARLHLGFLDPAATLGRRFGSLGLAVHGWTTRVELQAAPGALDHVTAAAGVDPADVARARRWLAALEERSGRPEPLHLHLARTLPVHAGFGSGTQLALAVGRAFASWHRLAISTASLAHGLGRGVRSGIGIAAFDQGGLLLDGGPGADGTPAPLLSRLPLPPEWRVLMVLDPSMQGLSGDDERRALALLPPFSQAQAADLCHQVLMRVLPGAATGDFDAFARGLTHIQSALGAHFAPAQDGRAYTSARVAALMQALADALGPQGAGMGQTSWGPTGFAVLPSQERAEAAVAALAAARAAGRVPDGLDLHIVAPRNEGAVVRDSAVLGATVHAPADALWRWPAAFAGQRPH